MNIEDLCRIVEKAEAFDAENILITPGRSPVLRVKGHLEELENEGVLHVRDVNRLVEIILTNEEYTHLEIEGYVKTLLTTLSSVTCHIVKSVGSFTITIELPSYKRSL